MNLERYTRATLLATLASALTILSFLPNRDVYALSATPTRSEDDERTIVRIASEEGKPASGWHIFLVGVSKYDNLNPLGGTVNDVNALERRFIELGVSPNNIVAMTSESATKFIPERAKITREYKKFLDSLGPNDFAVVYLSGHGATIDKRSYFAPADCDPDDIETFLSIEEMMDELESCKALYRLMIVDACRSSEDKGGEADKTRIATENVPDSVTLLQSCSEGESSWETQTESGRNGIFTQTLLEALDVENCPARVEENGDLTFDALFDYVSTETNRRAKEDHGKPQTPRRTIKQDKRFIILSDVKSRELERKRKQAETLYEEASKLDAEGDASAKKDDRQNAVKLYLEALSKLEIALYLFPKDERYAALRKKVVEKLNGAPPPPTDDSGRFGGARKSGDLASVTIKGVEVNFHYCAPGTFLMGSPVDEDGCALSGFSETQHEVKLTKGFWLQETETTQELWEAVMGNNPSDDEGTNLPVEGVSWYGFQEFIAKLNNGGYAPNGWKFSLPTEAQWEYACRAGTTTPFFWGSTLNGDKANCDGRYPYGTKTKGPSLQKTSPVKSYSPNAWGFYDMHGNVEEWVQDVFGKYPSVPVMDPVGPKEGEGYMWDEGKWYETGGSRRVLRGGSWFDKAFLCRAANRSWNSADSRTDRYGGRLALVPAR